MLRHTAVGRFSASSMKPTCPRPSGGAPFSGNRSRSWFAAPSNARRSPCGAVSSASMCRRSRSSILQPRPRSAGSTFTYTDRIPTSDRHSTRRLSRRSRSDCSMAPRLPGSTPPKPRGLHVRILALREVSGRTLRAAIARHAHHLRDVKRATVRELGHLGLAAEAVADHQRVLGCIAHRGKQAPLPDTHRDVVMAVLEPEGAGHPAAPRVQHLEVQADALQELLIRFEANDRLLVAVPMPDRAPIEAFRVPLVRGVVDEELAERERLLREPLGIVV